jgi:rubrerythrin
VIDAPTYALLQDIIRREARSLLHYVAESYPWTAADEQADLDQLRQIIEEEQAAIGDLVQLLSRLHLAPPYLGTYPSHFTTINFVSLDHLTPQLVDFERETITALEKELPQVSDSEAQEEIRRLLDMKRRHLKALEQMVATHPQLALR